MYIDEVSIKTKAGNGGSGSASFQTDKFKPRGRPDGGNGGSGGNVVLKANPSKKTLLDLHHVKHFKAADGGSGRRNDSFGKNGADAVLQVPPGTEVLDDEGNVLADLVHPGDFCIVAKGGRGGRGNASLASRSFPAPRFAERGEPGDEREINLKFKVIADVGLVGYPNVGKSSLISVVSAARPKIAPYPFTTLTPNLGAVFFPDHTQLIFADIPGLIEGAHEGLGLGLDFLKHVERTKILLHLIDLSGTERPDPLEDFEVIMNELRSYSSKLDSLPMIVVGNKEDLVGDIDLLEKMKKYFADKDLPFFIISCIQKEGLEELLSAVREIYDALPPDAVEKESNEIAVKVYKYHDMDALTVEREEDKFVVKGKKVETLVRMTDLQNDFAVRYLGEGLIKLGVDAALLRAGAVEGDLVEIAGFEFDFLPDRDPKKLPDWE